MAHFLNIAVWGWGQKWLSFCHKILFEDLDMAKTLHESCIADFEDNKLIWQKKLKSGYGVDLFL